jgi:hypothetical protein
MKAEPGRQAIRGPPEEKENEDEREEVEEKESRKTR